MDWHRTNRRSARPGPSRNVGEKHGMARLTNVTAALALQLLAGGMSGRKVAMMLGVSQSAISCLSRGVTWRHIPRPVPAAPEVSHTAHDAGTGDDDADRQAA